MSIKGIDVSTHQGTINWKKVKQSGIQFAIIRTGYGDVLSNPSQIDKRFHTNMKQAIANGIPVGVYHFSYAGTEKAARREAEKAAQTESPASTPSESKPPEPSASVHASAPSEAPVKPETSAPAESQKPVQSEPPTENTPSAPSNSGDGDAGSEPEGDFILDFNSLTPDDFGTLDTGNLELESGELLEVRYGGDVYAGKGVIIVKAKTSPNLTNKLTIRQNYHDVCELITNHGFDSCPEIQYWAVADMTDGEEGKAISFTLDSDTILGVANQTILPINLDDYLQDLWILPSLLE